MEKDVASPHLEMKAPRFVLYTVCISPHQMPLMKRIVNALGTNSCKYVYTHKLEGIGRKELGWTEVQESWILCEQAEPAEAKHVLENCSVLMSGIRDFDLFELRKRKGLVTLYSSERWFKPIILKTPLGEIHIPGIVKLLFPSYFRMAWRFRKLLKEKNPNSFFYLPIGLNASRDAALICCGSSQIDFHRQVGAPPKDREEPWQNRLRIWGYFVEPSSVAADELRHLREMQYKKINSGQRHLRILWVGRMLALKHVDTIVKALKLITQKGIPMSLTLVGDGPERQRLQKLSKGLPVEFHSFVPISQVREIMRAHDLYVFASNSFDGWGAVVSEAFEEMMPVLASRQCGAGPTTLPDECLFDCKNARELAERILDFEKLPKIDASRWSAKAASDYLLQIFLK